GCRKLPTGPRRWLPGRTVVRPRRYGERSPAVCTTHLLEGAKMAPMIVVTTNEIPGYRIEAVMGEVMGLTVRSANIGQNFVASFRSIGGGEVTEYTRLVYESRQEVMNRMTTEGQRRGANAVIGMRFDTGDIAQSFSELCAYGTPVH